MLGQPQAGGPHGGDGAVAPQPHADGLGEAVHGVGGVHAGAGAAGGAGVVFILLQAGLVQLAGVVGAHRLEHVAQAGAAAVIHSARHHGAAGDEDTYETKKKRGKIVDLSRCSMKKIRELIVFTAFLVVALWKFDVVIVVLKSIWKIVFPFALGGAIAFVINVPMSFLEKKMLGKIKENNKIGKKAARPISLLLTIILVAGVIILVMFGVIPQLTQTMGNLMTSISDFIPQMQNWIREFSHDNQDIMKLVDQLQFQPDQAIKWGISLLGNGVGNMMNTTMSAVGSIASGLATFFISFSFACYILFQKEKLHLQVRKVIFAFIPKQKADAILNICSLTYRTFANFLAGQCLEAVILGMMFVITLSILKMPYALLNVIFPSEKEYSMQRKTK